MADIKISLNQNERLLSDIVDKIATGVYIFNSLRRQDDSEFNKGLRIDRQNLDLLSNIERNVDLNDPASIERARKNVAKIKGSKHLQSMQNLLSEKYTFNLVVAKEKVRISGDVKSVEEKFIKLRSGELLSSDSLLLAELEKDAQSLSSNTQFPELNEKIQTLAKSINQYAQLNETFFGLDYDKKTEGVQLKMFMGINITSDEYVEAKSLIGQSHDEYDLQNYDKASGLLKEAAGVVADVYQKQIKQDEPRTVAEVNDEILKISTVDRVWIDEKGNKVQGEASDKNPIGDAKWKDLKLKQDVRDEKIKGLLDEKDMLQGISPKQRETQRIIDTVNKLKATLGRIVGNADADFEATEDLDPLNIR